MSISFSDTTTKKGIIQLIEKEVFASNYGFITGNTTRLKEWTASVNITHDEILARIFKAGGKWQFDDTNHTDYPIITRNLVSGQRDYTFTTDETGNLILDIHRVMIKDDQGKFKDLTSKDQQTPNNNNSDTTGFVDGQNLGGVPDSYDKTANGIFLDRIPNYNSTGGLKLFINREGSYFTTTDTTKKPGIAGLFHEYYAINPAWKYAVSKGLKNQNGLLNRKLALEQAIDNYYGRRERDVPGKLVANVENTR